MGAGIPIAAVQYCILNDTKNIVTSQCCDTLCDFGTSHYDLLQEMIPCIMSVYSTALTGLIGRAGISKSPRVRPSSLKGESPLPVLALSPLVW
jgi:hypothetical protein